jgi:hypothetical protein
VNEIGFASEVGRGVPVGVSDPTLELYEVAKLGNLAATERGEVKSSACKLLWIYSVDQAPHAVLQEAVNALKRANCRCAKKSDGNIECQD